MSKITYLSLNEYCRERFGKKLYKISLPGGCTCPNRDGTVGNRGCIFCSEGGSGDFAANADLSIEEQLAEAKTKISAKLPKSKMVSVGNPDNAEKNADDITEKPYGFIAYFQSYTGTYGDLKTLSKRWHEAALDPEVCVISIATRPDCLDDDVLRELELLNREKPVWVELGLQTIHEKSAAFIRRGYTLDVFDDAVEKLKHINIEVIVHVILGLPGENREDMLDTVRYISGKNVQGIKLQLLHYLKGTDLGQMYLNDPERFKVMTMEEYFELLADALQIIPKEMVVHRLTGDGPKSLLIEPKWTADKKRVMNGLKKYLSEYSKEGYTAGKNV